MVRLKKMIKVYDNSISRAGFLAMPLSTMHENFCGIIVEFLCCFDTPPKYIYMYMYKYMYSCIHVLQCCTHSCCVPVCAS